ncbi:MAG: hypothetical protein KAH00_07030 [Cocleimonas sp.]|nr:hypothetical protein [Cocleimonas sp.]
MKIKESAKIVLLTALLAAPFAATTTQASDFFGGNDGEWKVGPNGPYWDESDWPIWTPMYWMQEMMDSFDDKDGNNNMMGMGGGNNRFGNMPFGNMMPGNSTPKYGYGMPYGAPAPAIPVRPAIPQSATIAK